MTGALRHPRFERALDELCAASDRVWLAALTTGLGLTLVAAYPFAYTRSGVFWAYAGLLIRGGVYLWAGDRLRGRGGDTLETVFRFGLVAGLLEILVDWGLIHWVPTGRLVYLTGNDVVLLGSPVWMPLAWACVIVELGYPALRLYGVLRRRFAGAAIVVSIAIGLLAGVTVGFYEYFAYRANWWKYEPARVMIGNFCALYIPAGEVLMFLTIIPIAAHALSQPERRQSVVLESGALFAIAIALGYAVAYLAIEGL